MKKQGKKLIVMIPCYNEEKTLPLVIRSIPKIGTIVLAKKFLNFTPKTSLKRGSELDIRKLDTIPDSVLKYKLYGNV